jgi:cell division transport system permease protein
MSAWFAQHLAAIRDAFRRLVAAPLNSGLSLLVIGIALTLPTAGWVVIENLREATRGASGIQQISVFMAADAGKREVAEIESRLQTAKVGNWRFVSREEALKRMQSLEGMAEIVATLPRNPLPDAFVIEPTDARPESLELLAQAFSGWPKVAHVQLDSAWVKRFDAFLRIGKRVVTLLALLFAGALVAVTFNTIRLQILGQAAEIEVSKLIGATDAFIRRPFQYFGAIQGALGGLLATVFVAVGVYFLSSPVVELATLYGGSFILRGLSLVDTMLLTLLGSALGWVGAQISVTLHLRHIGESTL